MKCSKCEGRGFIGVYAHRWGGHCFECEGTGIVRETKQAHAIRVNREALLEAGYDPFTGETVQEFIERTSRR